MSIRVAILGYGNLGKGMECAVKQNDDMELVAVFTRRDPATVKTLTDVKDYNEDQLLSMQDKSDVLVRFGGSATDLPKQTAEYAKYFIVVDSFDTHARIPEHFANVDKAAKEYGKQTMVDMICVEDVPKRVKEIEAVGVDFIGVHVGVDQQAVGITPLEKLAEMKSCVEHSIVSVAGGINLKTIEEYKKLNPEVIIVGGGINHAKDPVAAAKAIYEAIYQ